jgi:hypothetical protein
MSKNICTAFLMGGLGNQMFQISNALAQSWSNNMDCVFYPSSYTPLQGNNTSKYLKNIFKNLKFTNEKIDFERYNEVSWSYYVKPKFYNKNIEFYGYYQSSKNFLDYKEKIIEYFSPTSDEIKNLRFKYPKINLSNTVSIHIRRGDYTNLPNIHPVIGESYIHKALEIAGDYSHIFIFTDDKNWVTSNLDFKNTTIVNDEDYQELWLMSLCQNNILSNSSFSWWGSYLNRNINKKTIAPSIWFGPNGEKNYQDIYESEWNKINVKYVNGTLLCE